MFRPSLAILDFDITNRTAQARTEFRRAAQSSGRVEERNVALKVKSASMKELMLERCKIVVSILNKEGITEAGHKIKEIQLYKIRKTLLVKAFYHNI
jgi:hypothetical protein